ncbi:hypothetical protein SKAU_G00040720 [Synaphobranchus kaupii]|uniref:Uncharacterized protein n=1 Tax=Synaphobranchus kaupii TaxID=118154 RepID=A0A9Q1G138_SYNKA|nr:hypothetical protein SKAU_G00040720 [Synaphobranchus kaupii]
MVKGSPVPVSPVLPRHEFYGHAAVRIRVPSRDITVMKANCGLGQVQIGQSAAFG